MNRQSGPGGSAFVSSGKCEAGGEAMLQVALEGLGTGSRERVSSTEGSSAEQSSSSSFWDGRVSVVRLRVLCRAWRGGRGPEGGPLLGCNP